MSDVLYLKPAAGRRVRKPDGALLREAGERVERSSYWLRRLGDGDVEPTSADAITRAEAALAKAQKSGEETSK